MKTHHEIEALTSERVWLTRLAHHMVHDRDVAEDVAQEALSSALRSPPRADHSPRGWLSHVARNVVRARHRSETRRARHEETYSIAPAADAFDLVQQQQAAEQLGLALDALDEPFQSALRLRFFDDLSIAEVAERQGVSAGTAGWRVHEGLKRLRASLDKKSGGNARTWLMALAPLGPSAIPQAGAPVPGSPGAPSAAARKGSTGMLKWIGVAAVLTASAVAATHVITRSATDASASPAVSGAPAASPVTTASPPPAPVAASSARIKRTTRASGHPTMPTDGGSLSFTLVEGPSGANGMPPTVITHDVSEYSHVLFDCIHAYSERRNDHLGGEAKLRVTAFQDPQLGPLVIDSKFLAQSSMTADAEFGECFEAAGFAMRFDEALGAPGQRFVFDINVSTESGVDKEAAGACFAELYARRPELKDVLMPSEDAGFTACMEKAMQDTMGDDSMIGAPEGTRPATEDEIRDLIASGKLPPEMANAPGKRVFVQTEPK